jgi:hypothetical protein
MSKTGYKLKRNEIFRDNEWCIELAQVTIQWRVLVLVTGNIRFLLLVR